MTTVADTDEKVGDGVDNSGESEDVSSGVKGNVRGFAKLPRIPHTNPNGIWTPEPNDMPLPEPGIKAFQDCLYTLFRTSTNNIMDRNEAKAAQNVHKTLS